jgi:hypothetical protein
MRAIRIGAATSAARSSRQRERWSSTKRPQGTLTVRHTIQVLTILPEYY